MLIPKFMVSQVSVDADPDLGPEVVALTEEITRNVGAPGANETVVIASTSDEDRHGDIVAQNWKLAGFRRNPVVPDNHNYNRVLGRAIKIVVPKSGEYAGSLMARIEWDTGNPDPTIAGAASQHPRRFRNAVSVGFMPTKRTLRNKLPTEHFAYREPVTIDTFFGPIEHAGYFFDGPQLRELSSATVPANASAIQLALDAMDADRPGAMLDDPGRFAKALAREIFGTVGFAPSDTETQFEERVHQTLRRTPAPLTPKRMATPFDSLFPELMESSQ